MIRVAHRSLGTSLGCRYHFDCHFLPKATLLSPSDAAMLGLVMPLLGKLALYVSAFVLSLYLLPQLLLATLCRSQDLKKKYGATWALVTGGSSGESADSLPVVLACVRGFWLVPRLGETLSVSVPPASVPG